jgi:hypothetical protein
MTTRAEHNRGEDKERRPNRNDGCKAMVRSACTSRMADVRACWTLYQKDPEAYTKDGDRWIDYGLAFDYVAPGTFKDQRRGYFRYQISYGGPSEEFRFNADENLNMTSCVFWYLDWYDGAFVPVTGRNREVWREIWEDFKECETLQYAMKKAQE